MTIDEAIEKEKFKARVDRIKANKRIFHNNDEDEISSCNRSAEEHEQLAEWLEELKDYRDKNKMVVRVDCENMDSIKDKIEELSKYAESQYNKAIDDFVKALQEKIEKDLSNPDLALECKKCGIWKNYDIAEIAEQLKAGEDND